MSHEWIRPSRAWPRVLLGVLAAVAFTAIAVAPPGGPAARADAGNGGGDFVPLPVTRLLDTRNGTGGVTGQIGPQGTISFPVLGHGGVPAAAVRAVLVDVAIVAPTVDSWLTIWPNGQQRPSISMVAGPKGQTISNAAIVPIGADGKFQVFNRSGSTHAAVDVHGYYTTSTSAGGLGGFVPVAHTRLVDTRTGAGTPTGAAAPIPANGGSLTVTLTGGVIPTTANAIFLDVVATGAGAPGWLEARPAGGAATTSILDYVKANSTASGGMVRPSADGKVTFVNHSTGTVHLLLTAEGYFSANPSVGAGYRAATGNLRDTRTDGLSTPAVPSGGTIDVAVGGTFGLPTRGIAAAAVNIAAADQSAIGFLRAWPVDGPEPTSSLTNFAASGSSEDFALVKPGTEGKIRIRNLSTKPVDVIVDLQGWFADPRPHVLPTHHTRETVLQEVPAPGHSAGPVLFAFSDNGGRLELGQEDPDNVSTLQWTVVSRTASTPTSVGDAYSGEAAIAQQPDRRLQYAAQHDDSDIWVRTQTEPDGTESTWNNLGGSMATAPSIGAFDDGTLVLFDVDVDGRLWALPQSGPNGRFTAWHSLGDLNLAGTPTAVNVRDGIRLFARTVAGGLVTAVYQVGGTTSVWTDLGGSGLTGTPAAVVYPGFRTRVFVRAADGTILTKVQDVTGGFTPTWASLPALPAVGSPSAIMDPATGRIMVAVLASDGNIYATPETSQASDHWVTWINASQGTLSSTDPTAYAFNDGTRDRSSIVFRDTDDTHVQIETRWSTASAIDGVPTFEITIRSNLPK